MKVNDSFENNLGILDNRYILLEEFGFGFSSTVYKIKDITNNMEYALKLFNKYGELYENEIKINKILNQENSPFFVKFISSSVGYLKEGENITLKPYIIFELCSKGEILSYIKCDKIVLEEKICKFLFFKLLQAVQNLHKLRVCHRDLKLDNFLFNGANFNIKLADFGFSSLIIKKKNGKTILQTGKIGTPNYMAPEILLNKPYDGVKADIFSLGVILFNLRTCKFGFAKAKANYWTANIAEKLYNYIKAKKIEKYWELLEEHEIISDLSEEFKKLYIKMVSFNPNERPTIEEIYNDEWMKEIRDLNEEQIKIYEEELIKELKKREVMIKH